MRDDIEQGQYHEGSVCFVKEFGLYLKPEKMFQQRCGIIRFVFSKILLVTAKED